MKRFYVETFNGTRSWYADDEEHAKEQHELAFGGDEFEEIVGVGEALDPQQALSDVLCWLEDPENFCIPSDDTMYRRQLADAISTFLERSNA